MNFIKRIKRLWKIAGCTHRNKLESIEIGNYKIRVCKRCGRVIGGIASQTDEKKGVSIDKTY